jgi:hypothetical protein
MKTSRFLALLGAVVGLNVAGLACDDGGDADGDADADGAGDGGGDADGDADVDADGDADADTDTDVDVDADTDADGDTDGDADVDEDAACGDPEVRAAYGDCTAAPDEGSCAAAGGTWGPIGISTDPECQCPTGQEECPCTRRSTCESACIAEIAGSSCDGVTVGHCSPVSVTVGCWCFFNQDGEVEETCAD